MIKIFKLFYFIYHGLFPSKIPTCRFNPTCSKYTLEAIGEYGFFKGSYLSVLRILNCHPLSRKPLYDPV